MDSSSNLARWLQELDEWATSIHRRRLLRSLASAEKTLAGDSERALHSIARLGVWAGELSAELEGVGIEELREQLRKISEFGELAFQSWLTTTGGSTQFEGLLLETLIPQFCSDPLRNCSPEGFRQSKSAVAPLDAQDFMRAWHAGLIQHEGRGLYRAPRSAASEQFFWTGSKAEIPRPFTLWHEPIVTVAALARLHFDFGWPAELIGTQSSDWAFDLVAFRLTAQTEHIAGEVKKTVQEVDQLVTLMMKFGSSLDVPRPLAGKALNAFRKVAALRQRRPPIFWALGPAGYQQVFRVDYLDDAVLMKATSSEILKF